MRRDLGQQQPKSMRHFRGQVAILADRCVFAYILDEIRKHPDVEEGGKYIGYVFKPGESSPKELKISPSAHAILITDFLPSGPKSVRTAVEFLPDGEHQEALFRRIERRDPAIEHLGTWHSHHCNGLETLSAGDVEGYLRTVNKAEYRLDFFLASLVKHVPTDPDQPDWIDHFLFVRGVKAYYRTTGHVRLVDWPTTFRDQTGHPEEGIAFGTASPPDNMHERLKGKASDEWYETDEGRRVLAEDRRFFTDQFGEDVVATRRGSQITLTGRLGYRAISVTYPAAPGDQRISVSVQQHSCTILHIGCDVSHRGVGFMAALAAAQTL